eukprot:3933571-Rhodomonas_salina.2
MHTLGIPSGAGRLPPLSAAVTDRRRARARNHDQQTGTRSATASATARPCHSVRTVCEARPDADGMHTGSGQPRGSGL